MKLDILDYYNLYWGGNFVTQNSRYLWQMINESESSGSYTRRIHRASYPNFQAKIVNTFEDYVFFSKPRIEGDSTFEIEVLAREVLKHNLVGGHSFALVLSSGPKIYPAYMVKKNDNGIIVISAPGHEAENSIILSPGIGGASGTAETIEQGAIVNTEAFEPFQLIRCQWDSTGVSFIRDTAEINLQIYNFRSVLDTLVLHSGMFITYGPNIGEGLQSIKPFSHYTAGTEEQAFGFAAPPTEQMERVRKEIGKRIAEMGSIIGLESEFSEEIKIESGEARKWRMLDTNATVLQLAVTTAKCVNEIIEANAVVNGGSVASMQLEPLLNPEGDIEKLAKYDNIISSINIPEIRMQAQIEKVKVAFADLPESRKQELIKIIMQSGGDDSTQRRPELELLQGALN